MSKTVQSLRITQYSPTIGRVIQNVSSRTGLVGPVNTFPFIIKDNHMIKAFGGALSLALTILVLRLVIPEIGDLLIAIIVKVLEIISEAIDQAGSALPK